MCEDSLLIQKKNPTEKIKLTVSKEAVASTPGNTNKQY